MQGFNVAPEGNAYVPQACLFDRLEELLGLGAGLRGAASFSDWRVEVHEEWFD